MVPVDHFTRHTPAYYNTNKEHGETLEQSQQKAASQEEIILAFFRKYKDFLYSAEDVHQLCFSPNTPLTSIRRAITNLNIKGLLEKTYQMRIGKYGKAIHTWKLAQQLKMQFDETHQDT